MSQIKIHPGAGTPGFAQEHWGGDPGAPNFREKFIKTIEFAPGVLIPVHREAVPVFRHLARQFKHYAPHYYNNFDKIHDDWGYAYRPVRGGTYLSNHSWGIAIDLNAVTNARGGADLDGDMPKSVTNKLIGLRWGGDFTSTKDPMHFEVILTPTQIRRHFYRDGRLKD